SLLGDKVVSVVKTYAENYLNMTDPVADGIATQILAIEMQRNELKKKYYERLKTAVGAVVATRFLQVENQLERLVDLQIAAESPGLPVILMSGTCDLAALRVLKPARFLSKPFSMTELAKMARDMVNG